jgi:hypothetical protein
MRSLPWSAKRYRPSSASTALCTTKL